MMGDFRALVLREANGKVTAQLDRVDDGALPPGEVTVAI
jgi:hypothetical protein